MNDTSSKALFVADNLALDFINSKYGMGEQSHDCFSDDLSVAEWMKLAGIWPEHTSLHSTDGLAVEARALRSSARRMVNSAMKGTPADCSVINQMLNTGRPDQKLEWDEEAQKFFIIDHFCHTNPSSLLWPIADSLVRLLTDDKFKFVRECEADNCVLLFHDLSKSHRRRWCSMSTCGNRMKVAAFRSRNRADQG